MFVSAETRQRGPRRSRRARGGGELAGAAWAAALVVVGLGAASGCEPVAATPQSAGAARVSAGIPGAQVSLEALQWKPGLAEYDLAVSGQGRRSVAIWVPRAAAPDALVIFLHGAVVPGPGRNDASRQLLRCLAAPALGSLAPLLIAPASPTGQWWNRADTELVLGLVLAVRERWPAAGARSVISGYSNGGIGAWFFARLYPEYFVAAIPMAFSADIVGATSVPVYGISGTRDEQFDFDAVRAAVRLEQERGRDVTLREKYRGSHFAPCSYVPELTSAAGWLAAHVFPPPGASTP